MKLTKESVIKNLKDSSSIWQASLLVTLTAVAYLYRAWPYISKPQLYAEDGVLWLSEGTIRGIKALFLPYHGFFHTAERLLGYIAAALPLQWAPLIFALTAWGLFILMAYYLLSSRTKILTNNFERIFMVLSLALIANFNEFFFNFSNSIFLMGVIGALILVARKSNYKTVNIFEKLFFFITSFTLPFAWFFLPMTVVDRFKNKAKNTYFLLVSFVASIVQALCYVISRTARSPVTLVSLFSKYTLLELYNQMIIPAVRFARIDVDLTEFNKGHYHVFIVGLTVATLLLATIAVLRKSNKQVWFLLFFLAGMTFASVKSPTITVKTPVEALINMAYVKDGNRYFVYGILAINIIFIKTAYNILSAKARYAFMVIFITFGLITSLHYKAFYVDKGWSDYTTLYRRGIDELNSGKVRQVTIPSNPHPWSMILIK